MELPGNSVEAAKFSLKVKKKKKERNIPMKREEKNFNNMRRIYA